MISLHQRAFAGPSRRPGLPVLAAALLSWVGAVPLHSAIAAPLYGDDLKYEIETVSIRATQDNHEVDEKLAKLADTLRKQFRFTGYKIEKDSKCKVDEDGENCKHDVGFKYDVRVTYRGVNEQGKVKLEICVTHKDETKLTSTVTVSPGKTALFGGWDLPGGDKLIIAVTPKQRD